MKYATDLKFKGSRRYLQGGDIYNEIQDILSDTLGGFVSKLVFKRFARTQIELLIGSPPYVENPLGSGVVTSWSGEKVADFWFRETGREISDSYPFEEDLIWNAIVISDQYIVSQRKNPYTPIENVISLTKKLNCELSPEIEGKWLFGQIELECCLPEEWKEIKISRRSCIANRFSRNTICVDGCNIGEIQFIVGRP